MTAYILRRLFLMIPTLIGITFLVFMLVALSPGGVGAALEMAGGGATDATQRALQEAYLEDRYGLDDPVIVQYGRWLHRISPVKFGTRDQISPSGEIIRAPKRVNPPPLWDWFTDDLPSAEPKVFAFDPDATDEGRSRAFRRASNDYSRHRAAFVASRTLLRQALVDYATAADIPHVVSRGAEVDFDALAAHTPDRDLPQWAAVERHGVAMIAAYGQAVEAREHLAAVFNARPFPQSGYPIIPGMVSIGRPDMGVSFARARPVMDLVAEALPITLLLNLIAFPIIYLVAVPSGMVAALNRGRWPDVAQSLAVLALWAIPVVWAAVLLLGFCANNQYLGWFPVSGVWDSDSDSFTFLPTFGPDGWHRGVLLDVLWHITLPVVCLVYSGFAILSKQTRAAMLDNLNADYVRTAKAKGVPRKDIILKHVFRNSLLPLITMFVTIFPAMLSGSVVVEKIFTIPGMGLLVIEAIALRDREIILAVTLFAAIVNLLALLLADILYALADPRISYR